MAFNKFHKTHRFGELNQSNARDNIVRETFGLEFFTRTNMYTNWTRSSFEKLGFAFTIVSVNTLKCYIRSIGKPHQLDNYPFILLFLRYESA